MTEAELRQKVMQRCAELRLLTHYCTSAKYCKASVPGLPDLIIVGSKAVIFAELKSDSGTTTAEQDLWLWMLHRLPACNVFARVWRPDDWHDGTIGKLLELIV